MLFRKEKKEKAPGQFNSTPATSRKVYPVKGAGKKWFDEKLRFEADTKSRFIVQV
jgi:hypothetical protein